MRKNSYLFLLVITCCGTALGQVNLQTGSATFSLSMFNWQDNKSRLSSSVSLNYNSGTGLKVNAVASDEGQGWDLLAGGMISRMQVGEPDDQKPKDGAIDDLTKYPPGYLYNTVPINQGCPQALTSYPIFSAKNKVYKANNQVAADRELDYFSFQFNGRTGLFVLNKNGTGISLGDNKLKIWYARNENAANNNIRTTIDTFYIQDENGLIYAFGNLDLTKVMRSDYSDATGTQEQSQPNFKSGKVYYQSDLDKITGVQYIVSGWHLTSIKDALTGRTITFNYTIRNINTLSDVQLMYFQEKQYSVVSQKRSITISPAISSISYPDGHSVHFNYGQPRVDMNGDSALASVVVQYKNRYVSKFTLNTSYFILNRYGTPITSYQRSVARLCLLSVKQTGVDLKQDMNPYVFDYYTGSNTVDDFVPPPFFYAKDIWGFYNGNNSVAADNSALPLNKSSIDLNSSQIKGLCFLRNDGSTRSYSVKSGYAKNGLLRQIIYPAGGSLTYTYDQNMGAVAGQYQNFGGVHVSQTSVADGGFSNNCSNPLITQYKYLLDGDSLSSLWGIDTPLNHTQSFTYFNTEDRQWKWLPPGCKWKYQWPGIQATEDKISLTGMQNFLVALSSVLNAVGFVMEIKDFVTLFSTTPSFLTIAAVVIDIGLIIWECTKSNTKNFSSTVYYNCDLNAANPLPSQFKRVEVIPQSGDAGKSVYYFTSDDQSPVWAASNPNFSMKQRFASWAYGLPLLVTLYDKSGNKVKETEYVYSGGTSSATSTPPSTPTGPITISATQALAAQVTGVTPAPDPITPPRIEKAIVIPRTPIPVDTPCVTCYVTKMRSQRNTYWFNNTGTYSTTNYNSNNGIMNVEFYFFYTGHLELDTVYEREYNITSLLGTNYLQTTTAYQYNPTNLQISDVQTTQSNGDVTEKKLTYSCDNSGGVFDILNGQNMLSVPVTENNYLTNGSFSAAPVSLSTNTFTRLTNGDIKPTTISTTKYLTPGSSTGSFSEVQTMTYDNVGNLIGVKDQESGRTVANIYDYDDKFVTAIVVNADAVTDKPAYTGFETGVTGGWTLSGTPVFTTTQAFTGTQALQLSSSLSASINNAQQYTLSFWATGVLSVSGGTLSKSGPTLNGFTYYEYLVQNTASVNIAGSAVIDELRLYPKTARMKTVAYDPIIGKISECDENNKVTYYGYDNLGRLNLIKDEQKNVLQTYTYNTAANQQGCPTTYYNKAISETIAANNCQGNSLGKQITYTIAANKYSSTISQADADSKAEQEINSTGQAQANTAGCTAVYYNTVQTGLFARGDCQDGYKGQSITYTVPAGRYFSVISQAAADSMAVDDVNANGDGYANTNGGCVIDTAAVWDGDSAQTQCNSAGHRLVYMKDKNPNSPTYNTAQWIDIGADSACPVVTVTYYVVSFLLATSPTPSFTIASFCTTGNQYTKTLYSNTSTFSIGMRLYYDAALTQPAAPGGGWVKLGSGASSVPNNIYYINNGVVGSSYAACPQ